MYAVTGGTVGTLNLTVIVTNLISSVITKHLNIYKITNTLNNYELVTKRLNMGQYVIALSSKVRWVRSASAALTYKERINHVNVL